MTDEIRIVCSGEFLKDSPSRKMRSYPGVAFSDSLKREIPDTYRTGIERIFQAYNPGISGN